MKCSHLDTEFLHFAFFVMLYPAPPIQILSAGASVMTERRHNWLDYLLKLKSYPMRLAIRGPTNLMEKLHQLLHLKTQVVFGFCQDMFSFTTCISCNICSILSMSEAFAFCTIIGSRLEYKRQGKAYIVTAAKICPS